jgi:hypothetical protein
MQDGELSDGARRFADKKRASGGVGPEPVRTLLQPKKIPRPTTLFAEPRVWAGIMSMVFAARVKKGFKGGMPIVNRVLSPTQGACMPLTNFY